MSIHKKNDSADNQEVKKPNFKDESQEQPHIKKDEKFTDNKQMNRNFEKELAEKNVIISNLKKEIDNLNINFKKELELRAKKAQEQVDAKVLEIQKKYAEENATFKKYAIKDHAEELINIISQINSVIVSSENSTNDAVKNYVVGFKLYMNMFENLLLSMGIKEIVVKPGDEFDVNRMEAIDTEKSDIKKNHVVKVIKKGYTLHDRVLVYSQVIVSK